MSDRIQYWVLQKKTWEEVKNFNKSDDWKYNEDISILKKAYDLVISDGYASIFRLQWRLGINDTQAYRIIDLLQDMRIINEEGEEPAPFPY